MTRLRYRISNPVLRKAAGFIANTKGFWDSVALPRVEAALKSSGEPTVTLLRGNFTNLKTLETRTSTAPGFTFLPRKGWDEAKGEFWLWVVKK